MGFNTFDMISGASKMWYRNYIVFKHMFFKSVAPIIFEPFIYLFGMGIGLGLYVREVEGLSYIQYIAPGLMASTAMFGASYECTYNSFIRMRYEKSYDAILATPIETGDIVLGEIAWAATRGLISTTVFLAVIALFGLIDSWWALACLPIAFMAAFLFGIYGMTYTSLTPEITLFNYYFTLLITPLFLFSGIFFPITTLPSWAQLVAKFSPLYHFVELNRALITGRTGGSLWMSLVYLMVSVVVLTPIPLKLMQRRMIK